MSVKVESGSGMLRKSQVRGKGISTRVKKPWGSTQDPVPKAEVGVSSPKLK